MSEHTILFGVAITPESAKALSRLLVQLHQAGAKRVTVAMNSPGGNVAAGVSLYNALRAMPFDIVTHNIGNVDSISNVVFLGGRERYVCPASTFMFHGVGFDCVANQRLEEKALRGMLDMVLADQQRMSKIIAERTGLSVDACMDLFREQTTRDATWAQKHGVVTDVKGFALPASGDVKVLNGV